MIDKIIEAGVKNRLAVLIGVAVLIVWGSYSLSKLPIDAVPDITNNQVEILVVSPNLGPLETERFLTTPIEMSMSNIPGLVEVRSISKFGLSDVTLVFTDETDLYWARSQILERLKQLEEELPAGFGTPFLAPVTTGLGEIYQYIIQPKDPNNTSYSLMELRTLQDWVIRKKILGIEGIADVSSFGGLKKEYQAKVKIDRLKALNVSLEEVFTAIENSNGNTGGAYIERNKRALIIRGIGLVKTLDDVGSAVVKIYNNVPVLVRDVADVSLGGAVRYGAMTTNGQAEVVGAVVMMQKGENASKVIQRLKEKLESIKSELPDDVEIVPFIDREKLVARTINTVKTNLMEGAVIVVLILILFLGDLKASLIAASVIPLSMLFAFGMMQYFGVVGNLMSLGALDFGLIVDGSVIVVEGVALFVGLAMHKAGTKMDYASRQLVVIDAMKDAKQSVFFGSLIILIVYFPLLSLTATEGRMFKPMAMTVSFAILGALILSLTYVPMMCAWLMNKPHKSGTWSDKFLDFMFLKYRPLLIFGLRKKMVIIATVVFLLLLSLFTFTKIGGEFIPKLDEGDLAIETRLPVGTSLTQTIETSLQLEKELMSKFPDEIERIVAKIGTAEIPTDPMPLEAFDLIILLKDKTLWKSVHSKAELTEQIAKIYQNFPGLTISIQQPIENRFNELLSGSKTDVVFKLFGTDLDKMSTLGTEIMQVLKTIEGAQDVQMVQVNGLPQVKIEYDRKNLALYGITVQQVNDIIQTAFAGKVTGTVYEEDRRFSLVVRLAGEDRNNIENIENLLIKDFRGNLIPLNEVVDITFDIGPAEIRHYNKQRCLQIGTNVRGRDMETLVKEAAAKIKEKVVLPYGYYIEYGGQFENLNKAKERLAIVVPIALLIIFGLLFASFGTIKDSLLIFTAVPLASIGGIFALYVRDINFSISAGVGFIALFGIAVLNGIMLVSCFNGLIKAGHQNLYKVVILGITQKFRPILMTSAVAALGFLPMAISHGAGAEVQKPLASVVIGGLMISTLLTLIALPVMFILFTKVKSIAKSKEKKAKKGKSQNGIIPLLLVLMIATLSLKAQSDYVQIKYEEGWSRAKDKNPITSLSNNKILQQQYLKKSAINLPNPELLFQAPTGEEQRPSFLIRSEFPTVYAKQLNLQKNYMQLAEKEKSYNISELKYNYDALVNEVLFLQEALKVLKKQDSTYFSILDINENRYRVGQISNLDRVNGESKYRTIHNRYSILEARFRSAVRRYNNYLVNKNDTIFIPEGKLIQLKNKIEFIADTLNIGENKGLKIAEQQIAISEKALKLEKHRVLPGLMLGYLNQAGDNTQTYYRLQAGITIPLFFWVYQGKIQGAKKEYQIQKDRYAYQQFLINNEMSEALAKYNGYRQTLDYYDRTALLQSVEVLKTATESYKAGAISYVQYLVSIEQAFDIEYNYADAIKNYNDAIIEINFLTGQNL